MKENLFGRTLEGLRAVTEELGLPRFAARQLAEWIYQKGVTSFEAMTNLPRAARVTLDERYTVEMAPPVKARESADGTKKYLFGAGAGRFFEAAWIPE
ncbi:MAG TPA: 23S rRNA (adenine(2503)-C(2))-methyltransferase RlmN, partial [Spirochaetia bacterium]